MSDFVQTMKDWRRMCDTFIDQYGADCGKHCPLYYLDTCGAIREVENGTYDNIAETVDAWAEENPEPQYPTWAEWFHISFLVWRLAKFPYRANVEKAWFDFLHENPIPADIAEKLGLKPKGGENDV